MADELIRDAIAYVESVFAHDFSGHDAQHTLRVYRLATTIAAKEGADMRIVQLAALLHDVDDAKLSPETSERKDNAVGFMRRHALPGSDIEKVVAIIGEVSFAGRDSVTPSSLEGKCVQDADRLDAIGAIGIARAFAYGGSRGRSLYDPQIAPRVGMSREEYRANERSTTVNHFYEKLLLLRDMLCTDTAKALAQERDAYMRAFLDEFLSEWNGDR